ncbi:hypothetical protein KUF71_000975 [Frankliniella fusca]|uniref:Uncharacterized protein n=1 Tax=Frankliniella fusca TaxID=407009 RepID=A0AAE1HBU2_9NEOP|nr:hypothetical protein KUF71_000975 [Frankliniella fusca]
MEIILNENNVLKRQLAKAMETNILQESSDNYEAKGLLKILLECAKFNANRKPGGIRYTTTLKELGTLLFLLGGRQLYEILNANLQLPSISTVKLHLNNTVFIREGEFRFAALKEFLLKRNLPLQVWLSEDGTQVTGRIQYCPTNNQVVGFVLPVDANGLPVLDSFPATSARVIKSYFDENAKSHIAYCIMAKPMVPKSPSFCLAMFGSDNKFTSPIVLKRWEWMEAAAKDIGLEIRGISSDGDSKLLKAMLYRSVVPSTQNWPFFSCRTSPGTVFVQDTVHLSAKLKSRLLKASIILPLGKHNVASRGHLSELMKVDTVDQHDLAPCLLNPKDKMNFRAVQKLCDKQVTDLLSKHIPNSKGTVCYLTMIREVMEAFLKTSLTPTDRIDLIWKWVFFVRLWRDWVLNTDGYTLGHNFITTNAYYCLELNAHGLIQIIRNLRDSGDEELFFPENFDSQPCESFFRTSRSMSSTHSTVVNYSILDFQHKIRRIDFIAESKINLKDTIVLPRNIKTIKKTSEDRFFPTTLPSDKEIEEIIQKSFKKSVEMAANLGLCKKHVQIPISSLPIISLPELDNNCDSDIDVSDDECDTEELENALILPSSSASNDDESEPNSNLNLEDDEQTVEDLLMVSSGALGVKTFQNVPISPSSLYVLVMDGEGNPSIITKQSYIYLLSKGSSHDTALSSDRLLRVMQAQRVSHRLNTTVADLKMPSKEDCVSLGDWCAFVEESDNSVCVGRILAFSYLSGPTWSQQEYKALFAPTKAPAKNARGLGCLCSWFKIVKSKELKSINMDIHGFYSMEHYICSLPRPRVEGTRVFLTCSYQSILACRQ